MAIVVGLLLACTAAPKPLAPGSADRPDIVLVSIDTLRADHLSSYGYGRTTSPTIDALARSGTQFLDARSASPWTLPSHATLLTGLLPSTHAVVEDGLSLSPETPRLAKTLADTGYHTGGFVSALFVSSLYGFEVGFERFEDFDIHSMKENLAQETNATEIVDAALDWWSAVPAGEPAFLFVHFYDVHYEYDPPGAYGSLFDRKPQRGDPHYKTYDFHKKHPLDAAQLQHQEAQYDEAIRYVDDQIARLVEASAHRKVVWVITADHGEELGERGSWGHAHTLYAEQLHVPLVVSGEGVASQRIAEPVGLEDVAPTLATWVHATKIGEGVDLSATLRDGTPPRDRVLVAETSRFASNRAGILSGGLRLEWDFVKGTIELFDDVADPQETSEVHALLPAETTALQVALTRRAGVRWAAREAGTVESSGVILLDGVARSQIHVDRNTEFRVLPDDASVRFDGKGPWSAVGGTRPGPTDPVALVHATPAAGDVELNAAARARLEALGYVQGP